MKYLLILLPLIIGCSGLVQVTDEGGRTIEGAQVTPYTSSWNGEPVFTDSNGEASVPMKTSIAPIIGVTVTKSGFQSGGAAVRDKWPVRVTMVAEQRR